MSLLSRIFRGQAASTAPSFPPPTPPRPRSNALSVLGGTETLEVVGESFYQEHLWRVVGGYTRDRVRHAVVAQLSPEPNNPYDRNAIAVFIEGGHVGHLSRHDAAVYLAGLQRLRATHQGEIGLRGVVVGGGQREGRAGMLGVFLDHDPREFGVSARQSSHIGDLRTGTLRTGLAEAVATDSDDDSYDLSWLTALSGSHAASDLPIIQDLLALERDPIDRHFMFAELEKCLYKSRDLDRTALDHFDEVCAAHDAEMPAIRAALYVKFGCVPVIEMYRQAAIRCQKARSWERMRWWAERGLAIYASEAARPEAVADLQKRLAYATDKLAAPAPRPAAPTAVAVVTASAVETLACIECGATFERARTRGRKPTRCPDCRSG